VVPEYQNKNVVGEEIMFRVSILAVVVAAALNLSGIAHCAEKSVPSSATGWDTSEFQLGNDGPCTGELRAAFYVITMRDSGQGKEKVIGNLRPKDEALETALYSSIDDVYGSPLVARFPYFVYRNITCMRRHMGKITPPNFSLVSS
jgi:hypothetical protein